MVPQNDQDVFKGTDTPEPLNLDLIDEQLRLTPNWCAPTWIVVALVEEIRALRGLDTPQRGRVGPPVTLRSPLTVEEVKAEGYRIVKTRPASMVILETEDAVIIEEEL